MTPSTRKILIYAFGLWGSLIPVWQGVLQAAPPSFELDLKELETARPPQKSRRVGIRPTRKDTRRGGETAQSAPMTPAEGDYTRYTVKPGDFLFRILIREFGMSNAQAEALIPEIQRINRLPSATKLEIGQVILIPHQRPQPMEPAAETTNASNHLLQAPGQEAPVPEPSPPLPSASQPSPAPSAHPEPPESEAPPLRVPAPVTESAIEARPLPQGEPAERTSLSKSLMSFWDELVPVGPKEPLTIDGKILDPVDYPILTAADGGTILVDLRKTLTPMLRNRLSESYPGIRIVTGGGETKSLVSNLLKAAEFPRIEENVTVELGNDPSLKVRADYRVVRLPAGRGGPENVLLFVDEEGSRLPASLINYLDRKGFRVAFFRKAPQDTSMEPGYDLRSISSASPCDMAISILDALSIGLERNRILSGTMGEDSESRFSIRVEGYFEAGGKRFILNCAGNDPYNYTLFRLLKVQGYGIVQPRDDEDFNSLTERILRELDYPFEFGRHEVDYGRYQISITGFKVTTRAPYTGRVLIKSGESDPVFAELLRWGPKRDLAR